MYIERNLVIIRVKVELKIELVLRNSSDSFFNTRVTLMDYLHFPNAAFSYSN